MGDENKDIYVNIVRNFNKHTAYSFVAVAFFFCTSIVLAMAIYFVWADEPARTQANYAIRSFHVDADGKKLPVPDRIQIGFWTPNRFSEDNPRDPDTVWQRLQPDDKRPEKFEEYITTISAGWRRSEVVGSGVTRKKAGDWWVISVDPAFKYASFVEKYQKIWGTESKVYIEEYSNRYQYFHKDG